MILRWSEEQSGRVPVYEVLGDSELRLTMFAVGPEEA